MNRFNQVKYLPSLDAGQPTREVRTFCLYVGVCGLPNLQSISRNQAELDAF